jgi:hypothetical protein
MLIFCDSKDYLSILLQATRALFGVKTFVCEVYMKLKLTMSLLMFGLTAMAVNKGQVEIIQLKKTIEMNLSSAAFLNYSASYSKTYSDYDLQTGDHCDILVYSDRSSVPAGNFTVVSAEFKPPAFEQIYWHSSVRAKNSQGDVLVLQCDSANGSVFFTNHYFSNDRCVSNSFTQAVATKLGFPPFPICERGVTVDADLFLQSKMGQEGSTRYAFINWVIEKIRPDFNVSYLEKMFAQENLFGFSSGE